MARGRPNRVDDSTAARLGVHPDPEGLRALAAQLAGGAPEPLGVYALRPTEPGAALARSVETRALAEAHHGSSPDVFAPYDHASLLLCVLDHQRQLPAGMVRLVLPSKLGLKTLNDLGSSFSIDADQLFEACGFDYDPNHTWDVATMAIGPAYRAAAFSGLVTMALCQAISVLGARLSFPWALTILHVPVLRMLQWRLHRPFHEFEGVEPHPYLDSPASLPAWMHLGEWHRRLAERDPVLHRIMVEGTGLEAAVRPPAWDRAAELAAEVSALADVRLHLR
jgi:hypothetical protein